MPFPGHSGHLERGGGNGQPVAPVAWFDLHRHVALVPKRRIATHTVLIDGHNARAPIAEGVLIEDTLEIDGKRFRAFLGNQARDVHAVGMRGPGGRASVKALFAVNGGEVRPARGDVVLLDLQLRLSVELRPARANRRHQVAILRYRILPDSAFLTQSRIRLHRGLTVMVGQRTDRRHRHETPVRVFANGVICTGRGIMPVEEAHPRTGDLVPHLAALHRIGQHLERIGKRLPITESIRITGAVAPFMVESRRIGAAARIANSATPDPAAVIARHGKGSIVIGSGDHHPILVRLFAVPPVHEVPGIFVQAPEIFEAPECALAEASGSFFVVHIHPHPGFTRGILRSGNNHKIIRFEIHPAGFVHHLRRRTVRGLALFVFRQIHIGGKRALQLH